MEEVSLQAETISNITTLNTDRKEFEPGENTVLLYGQHRRKEVVAYEVARRISKFSLLQKNGGLISVEYPEGADYNDAYDEAKKQTENSSPPYSGIREAYHGIYKGVTDKVVEIRNRACELNSGKLVADIHETTNFNQEDPDARSNGIVFLTSLNVAQVEELNKELSGIFPQADNIDGGLRLNISAKQVDQDDTERQLPKNYVAVELMTRGDDIYDKIASKEQVYDVGRDEREDYLHRVKTEGNPNIGINREATTYTRLLEKVLPTVEKYYSEKVLI